MPLLDRLKWVYYGKRRNWWYRHFKNCSLPYPYWSEKRDTFEWVYYDKNRKEFETQSELYEALGDVCSTGFIYHYRSLSYLRYKEEDKKVYKVTESHGHNFNEIVKAVYDYPETFEIPKDCLEEYSKQELRYLKKVQNYLRLIGLKDYKVSKEMEELDRKWEIIYEKEKKSILDRIKEWHYEILEKRLIKQEKFIRYENTKVEKYADCYSMHIEKEEVLQAMLDGTKDYRIFPYCHSSIGTRYFLLDEEENFYALIEFNEEEQIPFKDLTEDKVNYKIHGDKTFKEYKKKLFKQFKETTKWDEKEFTEDSPVLYAKFKIVEKFTGK